MPPLRENEEIVAEDNGSQSLRYTITLDFTPLIEGFRKVGAALRWIQYQREVEAAFREAYENGLILSLPPGPMLSGGLRLRTYYASRSDWEGIAYYLEQDGETRLAKAIRDGLSRHRHSYYRGDDSIPLRFKNGSIAKLDRYAP